MVLLALVVAATPIQLFVSSSGKDSWPGDRLHPFQTLERMAQEIKQLRAGGEQRPIVVELSGTFRPAATVALGPEATDVTIRSSSHALISGGVPVTGWKFDTRLSTWVAPEPPVGRFLELFVEGPQPHRANRPTLPKEGFFRFAALPGNAAKGPWNEGQTSATFSGDDIKPWKNLRDAEVVVHHYWVTSRLPIESVDFTKKEIQFGAKSVFRLTDDYTDRLGVYRVENVREAMDTPGQWIHDRGEGKVYYLPLKSERFPQTPVVAPRLATLLTVSGAKRFHLVGVDFAHAEYQYPKGQSGDGQAAISVGGAIKLSGVEDAVVERCRVRRCGTYGIELLAGCQDVKISRCTLSDLGGGGVKIGHDTERTTVSDCTIRECGRLYASAVGVWIGNSGHNLVTHNLIQNLGYTGVSVGWSWGYGPSKAVANIVEWNRIEDLGHGELSDMAGIYTLGVSPGTILRNNRIKNVQARQYGGWGIYFDEGSTGIVAENNIVTDCNFGNFHQHYGKENVVRNNIFAWAGAAGQLIRTRKEEHLSFTMERNIVLWKGSPLLGSNWDGDGFKFVKNLFWRTDESAKLPPRDEGGVVSDPLFQDAEHGDFRLKPDSPAKKLGFVPFSLSNAGPRG